MHLCRSSMLCRVYQELLETCSVSGMGHTGMGIVVHFGTSGYAWVKCSGEDAGSARNSLHCLDVG